MTRSVPYQGAEVKGMLIEVLATSAVHVVPLALLLGVQLWQERKYR